METVLIGCRTLERELREASRRTGVCCPCVWVESGLHNVPARLTDRLARELERLPAGVGRVLLGFGYCGGAAAGLTTGPYELILPRADDCITLMLGSYRRRLEMMREEGAYFLTQGWLDGERNIWEEFLYARRRYGEKQARRIFASMLSHYSRLAVVDTGVSDMEQLGQTTEMIARELGLRHQAVPGTLSLFERLLTGPWDDAHFLTAPPFTSITADDLRTPAY